jgi:hypothetical protein
MKNFYSHSTTTCTFVLENCSRVEPISEIVDMKGLICQIFKRQIPKILIYVTTLILFLMLTNLLAAQNNPAITFTTAKADTTMFIKIACSTNASSVQIDWGSGVKSTYTIDAAYTTIKYPANKTGESTIKIYGNNIIVFNCNNNNVVSLDTRNCTSLISLYCSKNKLEQLDISYNFNLNTLDCSYNNLTVNTLPLPKPALTNYKYAPQNTIAAKKTLFPNDQINLSSYLSRLNGAGVAIATRYVWKNGIGETMVPGTHYHIVSPGVFLFQNKPGHIIYCELSNDLFPELNGSNVIRTSCIIPDGFVLPIAFTAKVSGKVDLELVLSAITDDVPVRIEWETGQTTSVQLMTSETKFSYNKVTASETTIRVYGQGIRSLQAGSCMLSQIDISKCVVLEELNLEDNKLTFVDLTYNKKLTSFIISENKLDDIVLDNNPLLKYLDCSRCWLYELNIDFNPLIEELFCDNNNLVFSTLPKPRKTFTTYSYAPQNFTFQETFPSNNISDLSRYYEATDIDGRRQLTTYTWRYGATPYAKGTDYIEQGNGVFKLLTIPENIIYCDMTNAAFPDLAGENTLKFGYPIKPAIIINSDIVNSFYFELTALADTNLLVVDYGTGSYYANSLDWLNVPQRNFAYPIKIYGVDFTELYTYSNSQMTRLHLDFSNSKKVRRVDCQSNIKLEQLTFEASASLEEIECMSNNLKVLDVSKLPNLKSLFCAVNKLTSINISQNKALIYLACYQNELQSIDLRNNTLLETLSVRTNKLKALDISNNKLLTFLSCRDNELTALDVSKNTKLTELHCFGNYLNFRTLPQPQSSYSTYGYSPQANYSIAKDYYQEGVCDLSSQLSARDAQNVHQNTTFKWYTATGRLLVKGADYLENSLGVFSFINSISDSIYCEMSNPAFAAFTGESIFKTSKTKVHFAQPTFFINVTGNEFTLSPNQGSLGQVSITSNTSWIAVSNQQWLSVQPSSGTGNSIITFVASANPAPENRIATITLTGVGAETVTVIVNQRPAIITKTLQVSTNSIQFFSIPKSSQTFDIVSNTSWSIVNGTDWLSLSSSEGTGNATILLTVKENLAMQQRKATLSIIADGVIPQTIQVIQNARALLFVDTDSLGFDCMGAVAQTITVYSNTQYTISCSSGWVSFQVSGTGENKKMQINTSDNNTFESRNATITISSDDAETIVIQVFQAANPNTASDLREPMVSIYPNPASQWLKIVGIEANYQVEIYDVAGRKVSSKECFGEGLVEVTNMKPGFYLLRLRNETHQIERKITIK